MKDIFWKLYGEAITGSNETGDVMDIEFFCELIVKECVKVAMRSVSDDEPKEAWYLIQEHFGVEE